jgi:hypothetical protein
MNYYKKMYAILCGAISDALDSMERKEADYSIADKLKSALLQAEKIYLEETDKCE